MLLWICNSLLWTLCHMSILPLSLLLLLLWLSICICVVYFVIVSVVLPIIINIYPHYDQKEWDIINNIYIYYWSHSYPILPSRESSPDCELISARLVKLFSRAPLKVLGADRGKDSLDVGHFLSWTHGKIMGLLSKTKKFGIEMMRDMMINSSKQPWEWVINSIHWLMVWNIF